MVEGRTAVKRVLLRRNAEKTQGIPMLS